MRKIAVFACAVALRAAAAWGVTFDDVGIYRSVDDITAWVTTFSTANPDLVRMVEYGRSVGDRPLFAVEITSHPGVNDPAKPEFLFTAGIHAREVVTSEAACSLAEHLVQGYRSGDTAAQDAINQREVWIVPLMNPDGRLRVEAGQSEQRKNWHWYTGQATNGPSRGVDLNRNFPHRWSDASDWVLQETYGGPSVLSEAEASSLWNWLDTSGNFSDLRASVDFHSGATTILSPWTSPTDYSQHPLPTEIRTKFDLLANRMGQLTGFSTARLGYDSYGTLTDSLYEHFGAYAFTEEMYGVSSSDYFTYFNPITQGKLTDTVNRVVASSMYLLGDEAFAVPEPGTLLLLMVGLAGLCILRLDRRR